MAVPQRIASHVNVKSFGGKLALELECQQHAQEAVSVLMDILRDSDTPAKERIAAAAQILDRGYGKPVERSVIAALSDDGTGKGYQAMTTKQLLALALGNDSQVIDSTAETAESVGAEAEVPRHRL